MITVIRSAAFFAWMALTVIPWALAALVMSIFVRGDPLYWFCMAWLRLAIWGARVICGVHHRVQGMEHLPAPDALTPVILCPKHQSTWETFAFPTLMSHPLAYVFKKELLLVPFFGWAMGRLDMIHIDRSKRNERGTQGSYKTGASRLAVVTGAYLVPIAVTSARCWPRKSFLLRPGVVDISIGPPIASAGRDPEGLMQDVQAWIEAEMRRLDPEAYGPLLP